jgi:hypothetical protein
MKKQCCEGYKNNPVQSLPLSGGGSSSKSSSLLVLFPLSLPACAFVFGLLVLFLRLLLLFFSLQLEVLVLLLLLLLLLELLELLDFFCFEGDGFEDFEATGERAAEAVTAVIAGALDAFLANESGGKVDGQGGSEENAGKSMSDSRPSSCIFATTADRGGKCSSKELANLNGVTNQNNKTNN